MKRLLAFFVAALFVTLGADGHAQHRRHHHPVAAAKKAATKTRARVRHRARNAAPLASHNDELVLSPALLKQLQRNLADGGYLRGTIDGRLTPRTRKALAEFQREYHLVGTGALDRATAEALLGRDAIGAYAVAAAD
ncbi:MAG: putative peptidoglycan binding domain [bacterium]|nr:putative peptidoglycan binding domain [bacterium]